MMKQTKSHTDRKETTMIDPLSQNHAQENTRAADADTPGWTLNRVLLGLGAIGPVLFLFNTFDILRGAIAEFW